MADRDPRVEIAGREHAVTRLVLHPEWKGGEHDIALIELAAPVDGGVVVLVAVALLATLLSAWRASRIEAARSLRE